MGDATAVADAAGYGQSRDLLSHTQLLCGVLLFCAVPVYTVWCARGGSMSAISKATPSTVQAGVMDTRRTGMPEAGVERGGTGWRSSVK